ERHATARKRIVDASSSANAKALFTRWQQRMVVNRSETHLSAPEMRQILFGRTTFEVHFEVHCGEVGSGASLEKGSPLFRQIGAILRAIGGRADVDDAGVLAAPVFIVDGMTDIGMPEHRVAGHDLRNRNQGGNEIGMPLCTDPERSAGGRATQISRVHI